MRLAQFAKISSSEKIDRENGVIFGVSVITKGEAQTHGIQIDDTMLSQVIALGKEFVDGLKVRMNHLRKGEQAPVQSVIGSLKNFRKDGDKVRADLYLLKSDDNYSKVVEMAEKMPESFGLSIAYSGKSEERDETLFARCTEIYSCDLVDDPAANIGLFSKKEDGEGHHDERDLKAHHIHYGSIARHDFLEGRNPSGWAVDEKKWDKAKEAALKTYKISDHAYWPAVVHIYEQMGGTIKGHHPQNKQHDKTMTAEQIQLAKAVGLPETATEDELLVALGKMGYGKKLAKKCDKCGKEHEGACEHKEPDGDEMSKKLTEVITRLSKIESSNEQAVQLAKKSEIDALAAEATREGKVIPLSNDALYKMDAKDVAEMITKLPAGQVKLSKKVELPKDKDGKEFSKRSPEFMQFARQRREQGAAELTDIITKQASTLQTN